MVHLAVYVFFAVSLVGEQWIIWKQEGDEEVDLYYPVFMTVRSELIFKLFDSQSFWNVDKSELKLNKKKQRTIE